MKRHIFYFVLPLAFLFLIWIFVVECSWSSYLCRVSLSGILVFVASLIFFYRFGDKETSTHFTKAEIRRALLMTFLVLYLLLLGGSDRPEIKRLTVNENTLLARLLSHFDLIMLTIFGFYFGGRAVENAAHILKRSGDQTLFDKPPKKKKVSKQTQ